jgi:hypothetical protein
MIVSWGVALAVLAGAGLSFGQGKAADDPGKAAEGQLNAKELHRSASMYVLNGEDVVKKASDTAEARLKEYRLAAAREKGALRDTLDKKSLAAELTKERDELKKQIDQTMPEIQAQVQVLRQQQAQLQMQMNSMRGGSNRYAQMGIRQLQADSNQLSAQINMIQAQGNQLQVAYNQLGEQIKQLNSRPDTKSDDASKPAIKPAVTSSESYRESYVQALGELRKHVDEAKQKYDALADDAEVKAALATLSQRSAKIKYVLGPSKKFLDTVKALEQAEAKVASDTIIEEHKPADSVKRKAKTAKKKSTSPSFP